MFVYIFKTGPEPVFLFQFDNNFRYDSEMNLSGRTPARPFRRGSRAMVGKPAEPGRGISWVLFPAPWGEIEKKSSDDKSSGQ